LKYARLVLVLLLWPGPEVAAQEAAYPTLVLRPTVAFVPGPARVGSAIVDGLQEHDLQVEYDNSRTAFGIQVEYRIAQRYFAALGGQSSLHTVTTVAEPGVFINTLEEDRQLLHLWAVAGLRTRFITVTTGPVLVREMLPQVTQPVPAGRPPQTCDEGGEDVNHYGWTGAAMLEVPISRRASFSVGVQRHAVWWKADPMGRDASRFYIQGGSSCNLRPSSATTTSRPAILSVQVGLAIPLF
jgi:hypothetical protein